MSRSSPAAVEIIGVGARTPVGLVANASAAAVRGALSGIRQHPYLLDKAGEPMMLALDTVLLPSLAGTERYLGLACPAMAEALGPLIATGMRVGIIPAIVGLPEERPGRPADLDRDLATGLTAAGWQLGLTLAVEVMPQGHSAGLMALDAAIGRIRSGEASVCLVGGVDSYAEARTLEWLDDTRQLMSGVNRAGFPPGEAAGFCLVASPAFLRHARLDSLATAVSVCITVEPNRIKTDTICTGEGLTAAIHGACAPLDPAGGRIAQTWCDLNGERYRSTEYTYAVLRSDRLFVRANVAHPADCWGDVGAASGPLFACLAAASWSRGYARGSRALLWAGSEGGYRAAAVLQASHDDAGTSR